MPEPPEVTVTGGSPSAEDERAVREAILRLWREDQARAARQAPANPWTLAGRVEAARGGTGPLRARIPAQAWRLSGRLSPAESHIAIGRGDAK